MLWETARSYGIEPPQTIIFVFGTTLIEEARQVPGFEAVPVPVMNILMEYGNNYLVRTNALFLFLNSYLTRSFDHSNQVIAIQFLLKHQVLVQF